MNKRILFIAILCFLIIIVFIIFLFREKPSTKTNKTVQRPAENNTRTYDTSTQSTKLPDITQKPEPQFPGEITIAFYSWYIAYSGNPYADGILQTNKYLSPGFKRIISRFTPYDGVHDPVVCTSNKLRNFRIKSVSEPNSYGIVNVLVAEDAPSGRDLFRFVFKNIDGKWLITDIICK